jgi:hypothetical protein
VIFTFRAPTSGRTTIEGEVYQGFGRAAIFATDGRISSATDAALSSVEFVATTRGHVIALPIGTDAAIMRKATDWGIVISPQGALGILNSAGATVYSDDGLIGPREDLFAALILRDNGGNDRMELHCACKRQPPELVASLDLVGQLSQSPGGLIFGPLAANFWEWEQWEANFYAGAKIFEEATRPHDTPAEASEWLWTWRFESEVSGQYLAEQGGLALDIDMGITQGHTLEGDDPTRYSGSGVIGKTKPDGFGALTSVPVVAVSPVDGIVSWARRGVTEKFRRMDHEGGDRIVVELVATATAGGQIEVDDVAGEVLVDDTIAPLPLDILIPTQTEEGVRKFVRGQRVELLSAGSPNDAQEWYVGPDGAELIGGIWHVPIVDRDGNPFTLTAEVLPAAASFGSVPGLFRVSVDLERSAATFVSAQGIPSNGTITVDVDLRDSAPTLSDVIGHLEDGRPVDTSLMPSDPVVEVFWESASELPQRDKVRQELLGPLLAWQRDAAEPVDPDAEPLVYSVELGVFERPSAALARSGGDPVAALVGQNPFEVLDEGAPIVLRIAERGLKAKSTRPADHEFVVGYAPAWEVIPVDAASTRSDPARSSLVSAPFRSVTRSVAPPEGVQARTSPALNTLLANRADAVEVAERARDLYGADLEPYDAKAFGGGAALLRAGSVILIQHPDAQYGMVAPRLAYIFWAAPEITNGIVDLKIYLEPLA